MLMTRIDPVASSVRYTCWPSTNALCTPPVTDSVYSARTFGCARSAVSRMTMPFFRFDAPSRVSTPILPSAVVLMSFMMRASNASESTFSGAAGFEMSYTHRRPAMADVTYMKLPTIHCSRTWNSSTGARPTTSNSRRTSLGLTTTDAVALRSPLIAVTTYAPGRSATKAPSASTEACRSPADRPAKRRHLDRRLRSVLRGRAKPDDVAGTHRCRRRFDGDGGHGIAHDGHRNGRGRRAARDANRRASNRDAGDDAAAIHLDDGRSVGGPADRGIAARHAGLRERARAKLRGAAGHERTRERRDVKTRDRLRSNGHRHRGGLAADDDADREQAGVEERHRAARLRDADIERRREPGRRLHVHLRAGGVERLDAERDGLPDFPFGDRRDDPHLCRSRTRRRRPAAPAARQAKRRTTPSIWQDQADASFPP